MDGFVARGATKYLTNGGVCAFLQTLKNMSTAMSKQMPWPESSRGESSGLRPDTLLRCPLLARLT